MAGVTDWLIGSVHTFCIWTFLHSNTHLTKPATLCKTTQYTDECGNVGWLWNCSGLGLRTLPETPSEIFNLAIDLAIDLSENDFHVISYESFLNISLRVSSKVKALYLQNNNLTTIKSRAFSKFTNLCVLDLSGCGLNKSSLQMEAFAGLPNVKFLNIHNNSFIRDGYPDTEIPRLSALQNLSIDVFKRFYFNDQFRSLKRLSNVVFHTTGSLFNLTNVTFLGLIESPIHYLNLNFKNSVCDCDISEDLFCSFPFIRGLYFSVGNSCNLYPVLHSLKCLQNRTLDYLKIPDNVKSPFDIILDKERCEYLFNICAKSVDLNGNRITSITTDPYNTRFGNCVEILNLSFNHLSQINTRIVVHLLSLYPKLRALYVAPSAYMPCTPHVFPGVFVSSLESSDFYYKLSPELQLIDFSNNYIHLVKFNATFTINGSALEELYMSNTNFPCNDMATLQTPQLKGIDISNNDCSRIPRYIFSSSDNLHFVKASYAKINFKFPKSQHLFKMLSKLQTLDLSYNVIENLPKYLLSDQHKSLYLLNLDNNLLSSIPFTVSMLTNLSHLYVRHNRISFFQSSDIAILNQRNKVKIFIEGNPISCTCSTLSSLKWMKENEMRFGDWQITRCLQSNQTLSHLFHDQTFRKFELNCHTKDLLIYSSIGLFVFIIILVSLGAITKYRVHVDYVILRLRHRWRGVMNNAHKDDYQFDVFLSYSEHDFEWVVNTMYHELTKRNVKVSLPDKDFIPGLSKADEMLRCIDDSRKVVFVVTETFLKSGWESYAVQMTVTHAFHNNREGSMVVLMKDNVPIIEMPKDLRYVWWSLEIVKLSDFENKMDCFWDHVATLLQSD